MSIHRFAVCVGVTYTRSPFSFPEPCGHLGLQPSPKHIQRAYEGCSLPFRFRRRICVIVAGQRARGVSGLPVVVDRHDGEESGCRQLLALHRLRRSVE